MAKNTGRAIRAMTGGANPVGPYLARALDDGKAKLQADGGQAKIHYIAVDHAELYDDPEEWVRADFWAELIYRLKYPEQRIAIEVPIPDRTPIDAADLVVCKDDERTDPFIVIEAKAEGTSSSEFNQALEQAAGNGSGDKFRADYIGVVAGPVRRFLDIARYGVLERVKNSVADLPAEYRDPAVFRFHKATGPGDPDELVAAKKDQLIDTLQKAHNTLWGGGKMSPPQAFSELCKLLFVKIADEKKARKPGEPYDVQVKTGEDARGLSGRIVQLYKEHRRLEPDIFTSDLAIAPEALKVLVELIQGWSFRDTDLDVKGIAFELFMDSFFKGGFGQYFTPRDIVRFVVEMLDVEPGDWVVDPACGSAGFLLHALDIVRRKAEAYEAPGTVEHYKLWNEFAAKQLFGIEINDEIARVAKMNMILHGDGHANVVCHDALDRARNIAAINRNIKLGEFDVVITNVPFGAKLSIGENPYISAFTYLGNVSIETKTRGVVRKPRKTQKSEIIFVERIWELLRPGGRAGVILPDGILTNASTKYVRNFVLDHFQVLAIVSLPYEAFTHYGANVKASIVFLRKLGEGETADQNTPVFLGEAMGVGYDRTGRPAPNDLPGILDAYRAFRANPTPEVVEVPNLATPEATEAEEDEESEAEAEA